jgi:hypothetical protein
MTVFGVAVVAFVVGQVVCIASFPLHPVRSDMLPLIASAARRLLDGHSPYGIYPFGRGLPLTYLPVTWLAYLPAVWAGFDLRAVSVACSLTAAALLVGGVEPKDRPIAASLASVFLLAPYLQYRHDLYLSVWWLGLSATFLFLRRRRFVGAGLAFGVSMLASQFSWLLLLFLLVYLWRAEDTRIAITVAALALGVLAVGVGPFLLASPRAFVDGVFHHWSGITGVDTINLSYPLLEVGSRRITQVVQLVVVGAVALVALVRREPKLRDCLGWMVVALLGFTLLNQVIWTYFYLNVAFLLVLCGAVAEPSWREPPPAPA